MQGFEMKIFIIIILHYKVTIQVIATFPEFIAELQKRIDIDKSRNHCFYYLRTQYLRPMAFNDYKAGFFNSRSRI